jgi:hypothetical protein
MNCGARSPKNYLTRATPPKGSARRDESAGTGGGDDAERIFRTPAGLNRGLVKGMLMERSSLAAHRRCRRPTAHETLRLGSRGSGAPPSVLARSLGRAPTSHLGLPRPHFLLRSPPPPLPSRHAEHEDARMSFTDAEFPRNPSKDHVEDATARWQGDSRKVGCP